MELWDIEVIEKTKKWIDLKVEMCSPDAPDFTEDPTFALKILVEQSFDLEKSCAIGKAISEDQYWDEEYMASITNRYISKLIIYEISSYKEIYNRDENNMPKAKYRIWITDSKWIEHLKKGQKFDSAANSEIGPFVTENRLIQINNLDK